MNKGLMIFFTRRKINFLVVLLILCTACQSENIEDKSIDKTILQINDPHFKATVILQKLQTLPGYKLSVESQNNTSDLHVKDTVFSFQLADVDEDGKTDILLGITKKTHFEPVMEKRLQILRIDDGKIRPLWMGSRLCYKLVDFKPVFKGGSCQIKTLEQDPQGLYCIGFYEWKQFGLRLIAYKEDKLVSSKANQVFSR